MTATLTDASGLPRAGVKGPAAEAWLAARGLQLPAANRWHYCEGIRIARLGRSEFLLEELARDGRVAQLAASLAPERGLYPVLRQDAVIWLEGPAAASVVRQFATHDFTSGSDDDHAVLLTMLAGISVTVLWERGDSGGRRYSIYCDASYGTYLWDALSRE